MATDKNYFANGGTGANPIGINAWSQSNFIFDIGVEGHGGAHGVVGWIDVGGSPTAGVPTSASYATNSGVFGGAAAVPGVAGTSGTVGVFGQGGAFAKSLPVGASCGVLGTGASQPGVMGFSDANLGVSGTSTGGTGVLGQSKAGIGVRGFSTDNDGVVGQSGAAGPHLVDPEAKKPDVPALAGVLGTSTVAIGVGGTSWKSIGVLGQSGASGPPDPVINGGGAGVFGSSDRHPGVIGTSNGLGVVGFCGDAEVNGGAGVLGMSKSKIGVAGTSHTSTGVSGFSESEIGVSGTSGKDGPTMPTGQQQFPSIGGVFGTSSMQAGVVGTSNASAGVYGFSTNDVGVRGEGPVFAGAFNGDVHITGNLTVSGTFPKGCAVPFPDGTQRLLYCMESPEVWFEDFGTAKLKRGRAVVRIDADFAKVIKRGDYRVFVVPEGDCSGLYVRGKSGASFEVRELQGGTSSIAFSYRIVGRRKDVRDRKRFSKFAPPSVPGATRRARRRGRARSSLGALLAKARKQAGAKAARRRSH